MLAHTYRNGFVANHLIASWIVNLQIIYLFSLFIFQNTWLNCYIILFFYCLLGQLPVKAKIHSWINPACMLLTTICLYFDLPMIAATSLLFSHWLQGEQPIKPKLIGINLLLLQNPLTTFIALMIGHILSYKTITQTYRHVNYRIRFFKPMYRLLVDQLFIIAMITALTWVYIISLPTLAPNDLIFSLIPSCLIAYIVTNKKKPIESFLKNGYISLYILLNLICQIINLNMLPNIEAWLSTPNTTNLIYLVIQQLIQITTIGTLLASFNIQLSTYRILSRKRHTEGFHFVFSMINVITIIGLSLWVSHVSNIYTIAYWMAILTFLALITTVYRYPASTLKASLKSFVKYTFRIEIHGLHNLEQLKKPYIVIPNHNSYLEPPILAGMLPGRFMFPINPEAGNMLIVRLTEGFWQKLPMSPNKPMMLKPFIHGLKHGKNGIIFPEGQRSPIGKIGKIYPGAILAAKLTEATLVPVILNGSQYNVTSRMKTNFKKSFFPKVTIQIGKPVKVTKKSNFNEETIRKILIETQCKQSQPKHLKDAIKHLISQIGDSHKCLISNKKRLNLKQVLQLANKTSWTHKNFYHLTEDSFSPIRFLSALLNDIPIILGDINQVKLPQEALYIVEEDKITIFTMVDIMNMLYQWTYNAPLYSETSLFIACDYNDFRFILLGFIGSILTGATCIIPEHKNAVAQEIYLEHATALMLNETYLNQLMNDASTEELTFIGNTIACNIKSTIRKNWEGKFLHPIYNIEHKEKELIHTYETPFNSVKTTL
ncbi:MAG: 1-acyl-sn-glycerol-3-phosphate acyltransferase [Gammaproteobacteria bacterium]|nr:1-acyl-sn-glycerol-3-phosphate acyltransferase [Gammaproteobacteria bacterium]